ncbi:MAG: GNAT family N-acetyltransferase [Deltaproteobacteria bacterium]|nr:GNAT family N-acetyltransferase [Deltaproteobacteria bacterium]
MRIRDARPADAEAIIDFNARMAQETEAKVLDRAVLGAGVRRLLGDGTLGRYWLAVSDDDAPLGQLMVTYEWSDWRNGPLWWIQSVYVREDARRHGVYRALHGHCVAEARRAGAVGLRLYVEPNNARAIATYGRLGMKKSYDVMELPLSRGAA